MNNLFSWKPCFILRDLVARTLRDNWSLDCDDWLTDTLDELEELNEV